MSDRNGEHRFFARLYKVGINRCVDVPEEVSRALGGKGYISVVATAHGLATRTTLVPAGNRRYRLFLHGKIRNKLGMDAGSLVGVTLRQDRKPNELAVPADVAAALGKTRGAQTAFQAVTPALRREFLRWVLDAKRPRTRAKRLRRAIPILIERAQKRIRQSKTSRKSR